MKTACQIPVKRPDLVFVNEKITCSLLDFATPADQLADEYDYYGDFSCILCQWNGPQKSAKEVGRNTRTEDE